MANLCFNEIDIKFEKIDDYYKIKNILEEESEKYKDDKHSHVLLGVTDVDNIEFDDVEMNMNISTTTRWVSNHIHFISFLENNLEGMNNTDKRYQFVWVWDGSGEIGEIKANNIDGVFENNAYDESTAEAMVIVGKDSVMERLLEFAAEEIENHGLKFALDIGSVDSKSSGLLIKDKLDIIEKSNFCDRVNELDLPTLSKLYSFISNY